MCRILLYLSQKMFIPIREIVVRMLSFLDEEIYMIKNIVIWQDRGISINCQKATMYNHSILEFP
jgi:hypothetical protein